MREFRCIKDFEYCKKGKVYGFMNRGGFDAIAEDGMWICDVNSSAGKEHFVEVTTSKTLEPVAVNEAQTTNSVVERVLVNDSTTIVFFTDKTKQVVRLAKGDVFDIEKAVAIAIAKHVLGGYTELKNVIDKVESKGFVPIGRAVIKNSGALYSTLLPTFFKNNCIEKYTKSYLRASNGFMYDCSELLAGGTEVEVFHRVGNHFNVIRPVGSDKVYVIGDDGIEVR